MGSKRRHREDGWFKPRKRPRSGCNGDLPSPTPEQVQHPTLSLYYTHIFSLRQYLLSKLQASAPKARIRRIRDARDSQAEPTCGGTDEAKAKDGEHDGDEMLGYLLSTTFVCYETASDEARPDVLKTDFAVFSQQSLSTSASSIEEGTASQTEVSIDSKPSQLTFKVSALFVFPALVMSDSLGWISNLPVQTK